MYHAWMQPRCSQPTPQHPSRLRWRMMSQYSNDKLILNPGPPPRRKSTSGCKCILFTSIFLIFSAAALFLTRLALDFFIPHQHWYHDKPLEEVTQRSSVVQPLLTRLQSFDVAVTVWLRKEGRHHAKASKILEKEDQDEAQLVEIPLYSDIVFRGLHLTDKNLYTSVNFTVPTAILWAYFNNSNFAAGINLIFLCSRDANLSNYDLRASTMLIPTSSSLLDNAINFTTWLPDSVDILPVRSWPWVS